jgi:hypothetical protein
MVVESLTSTEGIAALAAGGVALIALILALVLAVKLRQVRSAQRAVLGAGDRDLVQHAARLEQGFLQLRDWVEDATAGLDARVAGAESRIAHCVTHRSLLRYDAYGEMSGQQSSTLALLDATRSGVVLSSILHRDSARVYVKQIVSGESELELSPEEQEAIENALAGRPGALADT